MRFLDLLVFIDEHQRLSGLINAACMTATGLLVAAPLLKDKVLGRLSILKRPTVFLVVLTISLFACRFPAFFYPGHLDPDEGQMLAQAITFETYPIPWRDIDGTTSGPINSYVLLWCVPLGFSPNYLTSRILELSCLVGMLIFLYGAGCRVAGDFAARLALMPAFLFLCWVSGAIYVHYSSEEVSLFLIGWALYLIAKLRRAPGSIFSTALLGLLLGLLPFAKLQSVLLGGFLGLTAIGFLFFCRSCDRRVALGRTFVLVASALVPALLILSIVAQAGALNDFWISYIRMSQHYGSQSSTFTTGMEDKFHNFLWLLNPGQAPAVPVFLTGVSTVVLGFYVLMGKLKITRVTRSWFLWAIGFAFVSVVTVTATGLMFEHYRFFLLPASIILLAINFRLVRLGRTVAIAANATTPLLGAALLVFPLIVVSHLFMDPNHLKQLVLSAWPRLIGFALTLLVLGLIYRAIFSGRSTVAWSRWQKLIPWACLVPFFVLPVVVLSSQSNLFRGKVHSFLTLPPPAMDEAILRVRPTGGRIAIWGWAPEYAAETQTPLGTRDAICHFSANPGPYQDYYRQRFLRDMRANRPELFLESMGSVHFDAATRKSYSIEFFPELAKVIAEDYRLEQEVDGMRLFIRRNGSTAK